MVDLVTGAHAAIADVERRAVHGSTSTASAVSAGLAYRAISAVIAGRTVGRRIRYRGAGIRGRAGALAGLGGTRLPIVGADDRGAGCAGACLTAIVGGAAVGVGVAGGVVGLGFPARLGLSRRAPLTRICGVTRAVGVAGVVNHAKAVDRRDVTTAVAVTRRRLAAQRRRAGMRRADTGPRHTTLVVRGAQIAVIAEVAHVGLGIALMCEDIAAPRVALVTQAAAAVVRVAAAAHLVPSANACSLVGAGVAKGAGFAVVANLVRERHRFAGAAVADAAVALVVERRAVLGGADAARAIAHVTFGARVTVVTGRRWWRSLGYTRLIDLVTGAHAAVAVVERRAVYGSTSTASAVGAGLAHRAIGAVVTVRAVGRRVGCCGADVIGAHHLLTVTDHYYADTIRVTRTGVRLGLVATVRVGNIPRTTAEPESSRDNDKQTNTPSSTHRL